ncbi:hypothetical protein [Acinetobacter phage Abp95]|nr:hypothetical protein [Acinetobacter phage Abp95]
MNLEQWQRSKKIKAEAEAAAKRTVERVLNTIKEPAMSEFEEYYKNSEWFGTYQSDLMMKEAFEAGQQSQQSKVEELQTLYTQQGINMLKLQKRVDEALGHLDDVNFPPDYEDAWESFYKAEQALKGEG